MSLRMQFSLATGLGTQEILNNMPSILYKHIDRPIDTIHKVKCNSCMYVCMYVWMDRCLHVGVFKSTDTNQ